MESYSEGIAPVAIIVIVAAVLALAGGGYYGYQKLNIKNQNEAPAQNQQVNQQRVIGETADWKTYNTKQFVFLYPSTATISTEGKKVIVTKFGLRYAELEVACSPDPGVSSKIYPDYSAFDQQKFASSLGSYFNNYVDFFGYRDPVATISAGSGKLFVFKGGQYCDVGNCTGDPNRLLAVACASGPNSNGNTALQCFTALSLNLDEIGQNEFIDTFLSSVRLLGEFTNPSSCIGVGETKG